MLIEWSFNYQCVRVCVQTDQPVCRTETGASRPRLPGGPVQGRPGLQLVHDFTHCQTAKLTRSQTHNSNQRFIQDNVGRRGQERAGVVLWQYYWLRMHNRVCMLRFSAKLDLPNILVVIVIISINEIISGISTGFLNTLSVFYYLSHVCSLHFWILSHSMLLTWW